MPKIIVETPSFDPAITVPEGIDSRADAADVVEALTQHLGNRTQFLKGVTDHAARVDTTNTFQQSQTLLAQLISQHNVPLTPAIYVAKTAGDGGGVWKQIMRMQLGTSSGMDASIWTRADVANERLVIATNAEWNGSAWLQRDSTKPSTAIMFSSTGTEVLGICRMPAGSANWTTWGFGTITAADYVYNKTRTVPVPLGNSSTEYDTTAGAQFGSVLAMSSSANKHFALRLPHNMGSGVLQIQHFKASSSATVFEVCGFTANWTTPGTLTKTTMGSQVSTSTPGDQISSITISPPSVGTEYRLRWSPANTGDRLLAAQIVSFSDIGPLNML
jgi:hypothetical protein